MGRAAQDRPRSAPRLDHKGRASHEAVALRRAVASGTYIDVALHLKQRVVVLDYGVDLHENPFASGPT
jgi:hypothetical protein